jgi:alkylglycerol monooxygenase
LGLGYMYVTINMQWPLTALDRVVMSAGLFAMIVSWGGILQARKWALPMEVFRLLYMAGTVVLVLHRTGLLPWTSWLTIFVSMAAGLSMLYFTFQVRRARVAVAHAGPR